ncbi:MAG: acyltransferase, partial [Chloroflexi bacterium]|nr:acyltransferase [Chloroflexota bacterium]
MRDLRVALAQIRPRLGDVAHNLATHLDYADRAVQAGCHIVVFPEQSLTGYFLSDLVAEVAVPRDDASLAPLLDASRDID